MAKRGGSGDDGGRRLGRRWERGAWGAKATMAGALLVSRRDDVERRDVMVKNKN